MILIYVTYPSDSEAEAVSKALLEKKLVACANIFAPHRALYEWEGAVKGEAEVAVIYKTRRGLFEAVEQKITALHSYDTPCIIELPIEKASKSFADWVRGQTVWGIKIP